MKEAHILIGKPFSGKNTVAHMIHLRKGVPTVDAGDQLRADPVTATMIATGEQISTEISFGAVERALVAVPDKKVLVTGFPRQKVNAQRLEGVVNVVNATVLEVPEEVIWERFDRAYDRADRNDHTRDALKRRIDLFNSKDMEEVFAFYKEEGRLGQIDASQEREQVYDQLVKRI